VEKAHNTVIGLPILYFTQLIGLAMGLSEKELELDKNMVSPKILIESISKQEEKKIETKIETKIENKAEPKAKEEVAE
jgi:heterodisulfide reductase subunit B2